MLSHSMDELTGETVIDDFYGVKLSIRSGHCYELCLFHSAKNMEKQCFFVDGRLTRNVALPRDVTPVTRSFGFMFRTSG
ncbi:hypothetical protein E2C01_055866 [Portunus trituberculatus]|uniref:Uncharacterized protein n=1 Tax=Portunus trituberculatus TaxID=210409 RepID=A0A5B7GNM1_PORTR|nr:hypothetical protein [Portunus trituberculatus]